MPTLRFSVRQTVEFEEKEKQWKRRVQDALKKNRPGDILVLADEAPPVHALRLDAYRKAGKALQESGQVKFALEQYEKALAIDPTDLESRRQLEILRDLAFRPAEVGAAPRILDMAAEELKVPRVPRRFLLFSGHMIDAPGRLEPRFPPDKEPIAARAISEKLSQLGAGQEDLGLCGGACGGDLLFAEAALKLGLRLEIRIPFAEPTFLQESITFAGEHWRERYYAVRKNPLTRLLIMPDELGPTPDNVNPYERNNVWQLYSALARGPEKVNFICLWNRKGGDGPGGTKHMYEEVNNRSGLVYVLDTTTLW
jgi:tetratricopeptide (TPR) repeat protein